MVAGTGDSKCGYGKIRGTCTRAADEGHEWVWIDTCCIDKTSSAELSEAINSMFAWYERSQVCYAYLSDVPGGLGYKEHFVAGSAFRVSLWFTRGWTLQELLAPNLVVFLDREWMDLDYDQHSFYWYEEDIPDPVLQRWQKLISEITGISDIDGFQRASVAQKMSWLSKRETTRIEDMAYCMLGIFGVYMPPLYGEEEHAFHRLQLEIIKISDDESIFAWKARTNNNEVSLERGLLAHSPAEFRESSKIVLHITIDEQRGHQHTVMENLYPYSVTNKGIAFQPRLKLLPSTVSSETTRAEYPRRYEAALACWHESQQRGHWDHVCIYLMQIVKGGTFIRFFPHCLGWPITRSSLTQRLTFQADHTADVRHDVLSGNALIYVKEPLVPNCQLEAFPDYTEIHIVGDELQKRLESIVISDRLVSGWVESDAFIFKLQIAPDDQAQLQFRLKDPKLLSTRILVAKVWAACELNYERNIMIQCFVHDPDNLALFGPPAPRVVLSTDQLILLQPRIVNSLCTSSNPQFQLSIQDKETDKLNDIRISERFPGIFHLRQRITESDLDNDSDSRSSLGKGFKGLRTRLRIPAGNNVVENCSFNNM